ncbi:hypothetical protein [Celeribacter sp.]|uniref:hypothetical protein n=1 Tax=Celeribacter sp. TaxID=1890673 RepID=UPI003A940349
MAKRMNTRRIRANRSYDISEAARACGVTHWTIRNWFKAGLVPLDGQRPTLIAGETLKTFLDQRQEKRRTRLATGQLYCTCCKSPTFARGGEIEVKKYGNRLAVQGLCARCETLSSRFVSAAQLTDFLKNASGPLLTAESTKGTEETILQFPLQGRTT